MIVCATADHLPETQLRKMAEDRGLSELERLRVRLVSVHSDLARAGWRGPIFWDHHAAEERIGSLFDRMTEYDL